MPSISLSVTSSRQQLPYPLAAGTELTMSISNPLGYNSYAGLESTPDSSGVYTSLFPKALSGSIISSSGIINLIQDDYKMLAVVSPDGGSIVYRPSIYVSGSNLYTTGTGYGEKYYFNFVVNTANTSSGSTGGGTFRLPLSSAGAFTASVDWGDGTVSTISSSAQTEVTHIYPATGSYLVRIGGFLPGWNFRLSGDRLKVTSINSWGQFDVGLDNGFNGSNNMLVPASDIPSVTTTSLNNYFRDCFQFNGYINNWDVSKVSNFQSAFNAAFRFNQPLDKWIMSSATNTSFMFSTLPYYGAFNRDIGGWDMSNVTTLLAMFQYQVRFNQDLSRWNTSKVTTLQSTFNRCFDFNSPLNSWDVSNVTTFNSTFSGLPTVRPSQFNQPLTNWNTSKGTDFSGMFYCQSYFNQDISNWNVSSGSIFQFMFSFASEFTGSLSKWDMSNATNLSQMFFGAAKFNSDISNWNTSKVTNMSYMFSQWTSFVPSVPYGMIFNQPLRTSGSSWNVSAVRNFNGMFAKNAYFNQDISNWNVSSAVTMSNMFYSASSFNQDISSWNVSSSVFMNSMFLGATSFDQNLGSWNVRNVTNMTGMFDGVTLSTANYDGILNGWNSLPSLKTGVVFSGGNSKYSPAASASRANLISTYGWTITDGGPV